MTGSSRSPEEIQREIGETQASLARTISLLERKLAPSDILEEVTDRCGPPVGTGWRMRSATIPFRRR